MVDAFKKPVILRHDVITGKTFFHHLGYHCENLYRGLLVIKRASALPCILEPQLTCRPLIPIFSHLIPFITHPGVKTGISFHKQTFLELTPHCVLVIIESIQGVQTNHVPFVCSYASLLS